MHAMQQRVYISLINNLMYKLGFNIFNFLTIDMHATPPIANYLIINAIIFLLIGLYILNTERNVPKK